MRTPTGRFATIVALNEVEGELEATCVYEDGQLLLIRACHLKGLP